MNSPNRPLPLHWDIFCRVIDNHGDLGVCWRLCSQLAHLGHSVRLWVDDASALAWMAPQGQPGVQVCHWDEQTHTHRARPDHDAPQQRVWVEAFGCEPEESFIADYLIQSSAGGQKSLKNLAWINLEYLSAEAYAQRCHGLPSPVLSGPGAGLTKRFFYPGFTPASGGLLRESGLAQRQARFDRAAWLSAQGIGWNGERLVGLFCYEPTALPALLRQWAQDPIPTRLLVTPGRAQAAVQAATAQPEVANALTAGAGHLNVQALPHLTQTDYDHLLWACDINCVRGEDSLVRALWAGQPLLWHIYPQDDGAHWAKLNAFLDWLQAPADLRALHADWNRDAPPAAGRLGPWPALAQVDWPASRACVQAARQQLMAQPNLLTQLQHMVCAMHTGA